MKQFLFFTLFYFNIGSSYIFNPFGSIGFNSDTTKIRANNQATNFTTEIKLSKFSTNVFADVGVKINIHSFFIAPRASFYTKNHDMNFMPIDGIHVNIQNKSRYDFDLLIGIYYQKASFYLFGGRGILHNKQEIYSLPSDIKIRADQNFIGIGLEYYFEKYYSFFAEGSIYNANKSNIDIKTDGISLTGLEKNQINPNIKSQKIKLGLRFYPLNIEGAISL